MKERSKKSLERIKKALLALPHCAKCNHIVYSTADRSQPSRDVKWAGTVSRTMPMHPRISPKKGDLCYYHEMIEQKQKAEKSISQIEKWKKKLEQSSMFNSQTKQGRSS